MKTAETAKKTREEKKAARRAAMEAALVAAIIVGLSVAATLRLMGGQMRGADTPIDGATDAAHSDVGTTAPGRPPQTEATEAATDSMVMATEGADETRYALTDEEKRMVSVVAVNADHTDDSSLMAVMRVIYNRTQDGRFPDTVEGVLLAPGQFESCYRVHSYALAIYDYDRLAELADRVWAGYDPFNGENAVYYSAAWVSKDKIAKGLYLVAEIGQSRFYGQG